ncbi:N-acetylmuramoyl-L-alanine amidase [Clostridium sporogenes]
MENKKENTSKKNNEDKVHKEILSEKEEDKSGFNWSKVPVVLVEMGFLSNAEEDKLLNTEEYRIKIVKGLTEGVKKAIN